MPKPKSPIALFFDEVAPGFRALDFGLLSDFGIRISDFISYHLATARLAAD
jgi:hypothetical protein